MVSHKRQRPHRARPPHLQVGVAEELVSPLVYQALSAVAGLPHGRTEARETEPVDDAVVDTTLPFLSRHVAGLVEFQRLTGCRSGEAGRGCRCAIDMNGTVLAEIADLRAPHAPRLAFTIEGLTLVRRLVEVHGGFVEARRGFEALRVAIIDDDTDGPRARPI